MIRKYCKKILLLFWQGFLSLFSKTKQGYGPAEPFTHIAKAFNKKYNVGYLDSGTYLHYTKPTKATGKESSSKQERLAVDTASSPYKYGGIALLVILCAVFAGAAFMLTPKENTKKTPQREKHIVPKKPNIVVAPTKTPVSVDLREKLAAIYQNTPKIVIGSVAIAFITLAIFLIIKFVTRQSSQLENNGSSKKIELASPLNNADANVGSTTGSDRSPKPANDTSSQQEMGTELNTINIGPASNPSKEASDDVDNETENQQDSTQEDNKQLFPSGNPQAPDKRNIDPNLNKADSNVDNAAVNNTPPSQPKDDQESEAPKIALPAQKLNFAIAPPKTNFFVGRTKKIKTLAPYVKKKTDKTVIFPPITGADGVGKTQFALELIEKYRTQYHYIVWIDAATPQDIQASYRQVEEELKINPLPTEKPFAQVMNKLKNKHVLYVFDNAPNLSTISPYLKKGHVLITSRKNSKANWKHKKYTVPKRLALALFSEDEALELAEKMVRNSNEQDLMKLIKLLPKYPLVINQLFCFMRESKSTPQAFLQKNPLKDTTHTTLLSDIVQKTLAALQSINNGKAVLALLHQIAYLAIKPIPLSFVSSLLDKQKLQPQMDNMLSTLEKHGLINTNKHNIHMHSMIQEIIGRQSPLSLAERKNLTDRYVKDVNKPHTFIATIYNSLGRAFRIAKASDNAIKAYNSAINIYKKVYGENTARTDIAMAYDNLGRAYHMAMQYKSAINAHTSAIDIYEKLSTQAVSEGIARAYYNRGTSYYYNKGYKDAIDNYTSAIKKYPKRKQNKEDQGSVFIANIYNQIGNVYYNKQEHTKSISSYRDALKEYKKVNKTKAIRVDFAVTYKNLGKAFLARGKKDKKDIEKDKKDIEKDKKDIEKAKKDIEKAKKYYENAAIYYTKINKTEPLKEAANIYNTLGIIDGNQKKHDQAIEYYKQSIKICENERVYGKVAHKNVADIHNRLGIVYYNKGAYGDAITSYQNALNIYNQLLDNQLNPSIEATSKRLLDAQNAKQKAENPNKSK